MAITAADFVAQFPEFRAAYENSPEMAGPMFDRALSVAQAQVSSLVFGTAYEQAVFLVAADTLSLSPFGENLRIANKDTSMYRVLYNQLARAVGPRVAVGGGFWGPSGQGW
jgi:hypothetical protein